MNLKNKILQISMILAITNNFMMNKNQIGIDDKELFIDINTGLPQIKK